MISNKPAMLDVMRYKCRNSDSSLPHINFTSFASSDFKKYSKSFTLIHTELCSEYITWTFADVGVKWFSELYMFGGGSQKLSIDNSTNSSFCCFLSSNCTQTLRWKSDVYRLVYLISQGATARSYRQLTIARQESIQLSPCTPSKGTWCEADTAAPISRYRQSVAIPSTGTVPSSSYSWRSPYLPWETWIRPPRRYWTRTESNKSSRRSRPLPRIRFGKYRR